MGGLLKHYCTALVFFLAATSFSTLAHAGIDDHVVGSKFRFTTAHVKQPLPAGLTEGAYDQPIDHGGATGTQTFKQRYWIDTQYAPNPKTAPVIYHICGEGDCTEDYFLHDNAIEWAKSLGANLVYLEHRYYGTSLPFPDLSNEHIQYLTLDNELADLAGFQKWVMSSRGWTGKWIVVGGSYSGTISAIYRLKHPELVVGSLAASAPMISGQDQLSDNGGGDLSNTDPSGDTGERQWVYQSCTTFGFWIADGFNTIYDPSRALCSSLFGADAPYVDNAAYNLNFHAPFVSNDRNAATNILFTYGSDDVWTKIGLTSEENQNRNIEILIIQGAGHHFDLNAPSGADNEAVLAARAEFLKLAKSWLGM
jgi:pimeloyl-ACP methyl ester carboxylesterase